MGNISGVLFLSANSVLCFKENFLCCSNVPFAGFPFQGHCSYVGASLSAIFFSFLSVSLFVPSAFTDLSPFSVSGVGFSGGVTDTPAGIFVRPKWLLGVGQSWN